MSLSLYSSSHMTGIDNSDLLIAGNVKYIIALVGSDGMLNVHICVAFVLVP